LVFPIGCGGAGEGEDQKEGGETRDHGRKMMGRDWRRKVKVLILSDKGTA
jgi:hypothetical protein